MRIIPMLGALVLLSISVGGCASSGPTEQDKAFDAQLAQAAKNKGEPTQKGAGRASMPGVGSPSAPAGTPPGTKGMGAPTGGGAPATPPASTGK